MIMLGGYGKLGAPHTLIQSLAEKKAKDLTVVSGIVGCAGKASAIQSLLENQQIKKLVTSYVGDNPLVHEQFLKGHLEVLLEPLGTIAEKVRSGGYGIPAFYSRVGAGTYLEDGGIPIKMDKDGKTILAVNLAKSKRQFKGQDYLMEKTLLGDFSLVRAWKADTKGNCILKLASRNFNPDMAIAGKVCIVEAEEIVEPGALDGDDIHIPGIFVHKIVKATPGATACKHEACTCPLGDAATRPKREMMVRRAAREIKPGTYVSLGSGLAKTIEHFLPENFDVHFVCPETGVFGAVHERPNFGGQCTRGTHACLSDLLDGCLKPIKLRKNAAISRASEAFSSVRGGHLGCVFMDGYQVSANGDLANIHREGMLFLEPGTNIDLAASGSPVVVLMEMMTGGKPNLLPNCNLHLTGQKCVRTLITDVGVFEFRPDGMTLTELAPGITVDAVRAMTPCKFLTASNLGSMA